MKVKLQIHISIVLSMTVLWSCKQDVHIGEANIDYNAAFSALEILEDRAPGIRCTRNCISMAAAPRWRLEPYTVASVDLTKKEISIIHFPIKLLLKQFAITDNELLEFQRYIDVISGANNIYLGAKDMNDGSIFFGKICRRFTCVRFGIYRELNYKNSISISNDIQIDRSAKNILDLARQILQISALKWPYVGEDNRP